jgi:hypothetical protein
MRQGATLDITATINGTATTGTFVFDTGLTLSPTIRTGELVGANGQIVQAAIKKISGQQGGFKFRLSGGVPVADIEFQSFEGSSNQWGDGSGIDARDATGDGVFRQISVLYKYLIESTSDSLGAATLSWGEFSSSGVYEPFKVAPEEPEQTLDVSENTSTFSGRVRLVSVATIDDAPVSQEQDED